MKRYSAILFLFVFLLVFSSCSTVVIPNSAEAKEKLSALGYEVAVETMYGEQVEAYGITQVTTLDAKKEEDYIQVYFFHSEEDCDTFYRIRGYALSNPDEVLRKNKYSFYRGSEKAVDDFLG